ncbi:hypothetical protein SBRCBS47491_008630 [Sporothrix bragantina]|uniref:RTA1 domain protein n=1 Tax=Sporothrix bragantina TaxID=671064 RepID=A0ABP0CMY6_9PEZI
MPTLETHNGYALWHYIPNRPAAIIFVVLFAIATVYHGTALIRHRLWFCIPFVIGGVFEVIGYIGRILAYNQTGDVIPYILQSIFLLLAPVLFAASLYMTLGRVVLHTIHNASSGVSLSSLSLIPPRWITRIFVTADILSFFIQGGGGGMLVKATTASDTKTGQNIIVGGLIFQLVAFAVFISAVAVFDLRCRRLSIQPARFILPMLYVTSVLVMLRNLMRVVEYAMGQDGYLLQHEWPIYVLDGVPMLIVMAAFAAGYPSVLKQAPKNVTGGVTPINSYDVEMGERAANERR